MLTSISAGLAGLAQPGREDRKPGILNLDSES